MELEAGNRLLSIGILLVVGGVLLYGYNSLETQQFNQKVKQCTSDSQCIVVDTIQGNRKLPSGNSCGCYYNTAINRKYNESWYDKKADYERKHGCRVQCKATVPRGEITANCVEGKCELDLKR